MAASSRLGGPAVVVSGVGLVAIAIRLPGTFSQALSQDEVASARILREPTVLSMLGRVSRTESTPPFWYALAWVVHHLGASIVDVRVVSVLAGGGVAACVVAIGRRVLPLSAAVLAGLLVAVGGEFVAHGHELRSYELLALLSAVFVLLLLRELEEPGRSTEIAIGAVVGLGGLTHYFFAFAVIAGLAWLWLDPGAVRLRRRTSIAIVAGGLVAAAWAPVLAVQYHRDRFWWIGAFRLRKVLAVPLRLFTSTYDNQSIGRSLSLLFVLAVALGCVRLARIGPAGRLIAVLAVGPLVAAAALWAGGVEIFALRNLIELGPAVAIAVAALLTAAPARVGVAAGLVLASALGISVLRHEGTGVPPFAAIAQALVQEGWRPSDPVAVVGNLFVFRAPLEWYLPHAAVLDAARPMQRVCGTVFLVAPRRRSRPAAGRVADRGAGRYVVSRFRLTVPLETERLFHHASILVGAAHPSRCVRAIRTGRLAPIT
jgi:4-amino-4-deoxy-L-arabinose transferase-like glycosyltransferase